MFIDSPQEAQAFNTWLVYISVLAFILFCIAIVTIFRFLKGDKKAGYRALLFLLVVLLGGLGLPVILKIWHL